MTELTVIETGEVVEQMTTVEAERITARIADMLDGIADNLERVMPLIGEALTRRAWDALGYTSPGAYVEERFSTALHRLPVAVRRPVVAELSAAGMSTRDIAPIIGTSNKTVHQDLHAEVLPEVTPAPERRAVDAPAHTFTDEPGTVQQVTGTTQDWGLPKSDKIIGRDGKTYTRPAQQEAPKPKRRPLTDTAREVGLDLRKITERIERMTGDDRFSTNKNEVAAHLRHHLAYAQEVLADLDSAINN